MPLTPTAQAPIERGMSAGFMLIMRDGEREVPVIVSHEALGVFRPGAPDPQRSLAEHRQAVEAAASAKYDRGEVVSKNGHVMIVVKDMA